LYDRLDTALNKLIHAGRLPSTEPRGELPLETAEGVPVTIRYDLSAESTVRPAVISIGRLVNSIPGVLEAFVPERNLPTLNSIPGVLNVTMITPALERLIGQGPSVHNATHWQLNGYTGAGVKVGIIDSFSGFSALMGSELPSSVTARCYYDIGAYTSNIPDCELGNDHGTAVAEALIDVAPAVSLYIARTLSPLNFRAAVEWMIAQGVKVINYSAAQNWDGPGDGTSPNPDSYLNVVNTAVAGGAVFVAAAGNQGEKSWFGGFSDANSNGWMEFSAGNELNSILLFAGETIQVNMRWQDSWIADAESSGFSLA
jgi:hypothetical protein